MYQRRETQSPRNSFDRSKQVNERTWLCQSKGRGVLNRRNSIDTRAVRLSVSARSLLLIVALATLAAATNAQTLQSFRCTFGPGVAANWDKGKLGIERTNFGKPSAEIVFDAINIKDGTGRIIGNGGASDISVVSIYPLTLLELTGSGNPIITTIFQRQADTNGQLAAVMSRHVVSFGGALPSQYYGTCKPL